jgi:hypothetical protein
VYIETTSHEENGIRGKVQGRNAHRVKEDEESL